jgi:hypothetical protein
LLAAKSPATSSATPYDIHEDARGGNAQPLDQRGDDDLDCVIGCPNPKGTLGSGWIESVVPQRQLDFAHEVPYARKKTLGPRR